MAIVVYAHRYKRPPPKQKLRAAEIAAMMVVYAPETATVESGKKRPVTKPQSAGTSRRPPLPTVVVATGEKRLKAAAS
jgi:hypothetical protein